jgi:hypothetical protein
MVTISTICSILLLAAGVCMFTRTERDFADLI